jgi:segregation and condensation protein A
VSFDDEDELRAPAQDALQAAWSGSEDGDGARDDLEKEIAAAGAGSDPGIALLLELARAGKIDPWNVDIIKVTDEYLRALDKLDPRDLARSARCIFYAAALVHLKARALAERHSRALLDAALTQDMGDGGEEGWGRGLRPGDLPLLYPDADAILTPRERRPRARGVTLLDLILALRSFDERLAAREEAAFEIPDFNGDMAQDECLGVTHRDDLERDKAEIRAILEQRNALRPGAPTSDLDLVGPERPRVAIFLALLSLAADEEIELDQDALYGSLMVRLGPLFGKPRAPEPPASEPGALEPAAAVATATPASTQESPS